MKLLRLMQKGASEKMDSARQLLVHYSYPLNRYNASGLACGFHENVVRRASSEDI
jgi:hypothetical protein